VHAWTGASRWNKRILAGKPEEEPVPKGVNWDLWLGPRETRPTARLQPVTCAISGILALLPSVIFLPHFDPACWAWICASRSVSKLRLLAASTLTSHPWRLYTYHFGPRNGAHGNMPPSSSPGTKAADAAAPRRTRRGRPTGRQWQRHPVRRDKGLLTCAGWAGRATCCRRKRCRVQAAKDYVTPFQGPSSRLARRLQRGAPASANFEYGAALTEVGLLGLVALRTGKTLYWDSKAMKATNAPEADKFLKETIAPAGKWRSINGARTFLSAAKPETATALNAFAYRWYLCCRK